MELTGGYPFPLINEALLYSYPKLRRHIKTQVAIIGGGISGALTAYQLIRAGIETILVDARSIGLGSSSASTSLLQYELDMPLHQLIPAVGNDNAIRAYQCCGKAIGSIISIAKQIGYTDYEANNSLFFSTRKGETGFMNREYKARKAAGFDVTLLQDDDLKKKYGLKAHIGIRSRLGASINTYTFVHELLQFCIKKGLQVYDRTRITKMNAGKNSIELITEEGCRIRASHAVNATGYEVVNFIGKRIVNFDCTYALVSEQQFERFPLTKERTMFWNTADPYLYMRFTRDNRVLGGGRDEPFSNRVTRQLYLEKKAVQLEKDIKKVLPDLKFKTEFTWSGTFGKTRDSLPYIGFYYKTPRVLYALGFGGNGITFSQVAAEITRDLLMGKKNRDAVLFSFTR